MGKFFDWLLELSKNTEKKLLELVKDDPDTFSEIDNIGDIENYLDDLVRRNESGEIQAEDRITYLKEFLALYNKWQIEKGAIKHSGEDKL